MDLEGFVTFLNTRIKIGGKTGVLGNQVNVALDESGNFVVVTVTIPFSKRYLKYLTKKFLKKQKLRDHIRVIATTKDGYYLKYYPIGDAGEEDEEAE